MYKCKHFNIWELVPKQVYHDRGDKAWALLDVNMLMTIDFLRERFGKITINDWYWNGRNQWRGLRTSDSPYYSKYSQHSFGRAFDLIFHETTAEKVRQDIKDNPNLFGYRSITSYEEGTSWLHIDNRNTQRLLTFPAPITHV